MIFPKFDLKFLDEKFTLEIFLTCSKLTARLNIYPIYNEINGTDLICNGILE